MIIAKSLHHILDNRIVSASLDKSKRIDSLVNEVLSMWEADLTERRPAPAYFEGSDGEPIYQGTDLDLFTLLMALGQRKAVINIPDYEHLRISSLRSNQYIVARENRHGQIIRPVSNLDTHAFSALIKDFNVVEIKKGREIVGAPRNFAIVDDSGKFYDGWSKFEWRSTPEEDAFIRKNQLEAYKGTIEFQYFVHPALAGSFYGSPYIITKILAFRIADQTEHYKKLAQHLREQGVKLPPPKDEEVVIHWKEGITEPIKVKNLEARLVLPEYHGKYPLYGMEELEQNKKPQVKIYDRMPTTLKGKREVLRYSLWISKKLTRKYGPMVRVPVRAVELAFFLYGFKSPDKEAGSEIKPGWAVPDWQRDYKEGPRTRIRWNQLEFNQYVKLLYRMRETTAHRSVSF